VGPSGFQARFFGEQAAVKFRQKVSQLFQIAAVVGCGEADFLRRLSVQGLQTEAVRGSQNLVQQGGKVLGGEGGAILLLAAESK
jgi:hypothetical protein